GDSVGDSVGDSSGVAVGGVSVSTDPSAIGPSTVGVGVTSSARDPDSGIAPISTIRATTIRTRKTRPIGRDDAILGIMRWSSRPRRRAYGDSNLAGMRTNRKPAPGSPIIRIANTMTMRRIVPDTIVGYRPRRRATIPSIGPTTVTIHADPPTRHR